MAHEISILGDGTAEAMYYQTAAWHGLGQVYNAEVAPDSQIALEHSGLGKWEPIMEELVLKSDGAEVTDFRSVVRSDNRRTLGIVSPSYEVFGNRAMFDFLDSLCQDNVMRYESAMALKGGSIIAILARMPSVDQVSDDDKSYRYVLITSSHDGTRNLTIKPTSVRVVCMNTLRVALGDKKSKNFSVSIKHTESLQSKLDIARRAISQLDKAFTLHNDNARLLIERKYRKDLVDQYIHTLYPQPADTAHQRKKTAYENLMDRLRVSFKHPTNNLPHMKGTWWQVLNAVTFVEEHEGRTRGKDDKERQENRFLNLTEGNADEFKGRAFELALEISA